MTQLIIANEADSEDTKRQILQHNLTYLEICGE